MRNILLMFIISLVILYFAVLTISPVDLGEEYKIVENLEVTGMDDDISLITFFSGAQHLEMYISAEQGYSIEMALAGVRTMRPMTHDLQADILRATNTRIVAVSIDTFVQNYFTATLYLKTGPFLSVVDCRPSDCAALALRTGAPIYIHDILLLESVYEQGNLTDVVIV